MQLVSLSVQSKFLILVSLYLMILLMTIQYICFLQHYVIQKLFPRLLRAKYSLPLITSLLNMKINI